MDAVLLILSLIVADECPGSPYSLPSASPSIVQVNMSHILVTNNQSTPNTTKHFYCNDQQEYTVQLKMMMPWGEWVIAIAEMKRTKPQHWSHSAWKPILIVKVLVYKLLLTMTEDMVPEECCHTANFDFFWFCRLCCNVKLMNVQYQVY